MCWITMWAFLPLVLSVMSYADWDRVLDVNINGLFNGIKTFFQIFLRSASVAERYNIGRHWAVCDSHWSYLYGIEVAVIGMIEALRAELTNTNTGVSVFCPGFVKSNIEENGFRQSPSEKLCELEFLHLVEGRSQATDNPALALNPRGAGNIVMRGMRNNGPCILLHPSHDIIRRSEGIVARLHRIDSPLGSARTWYARNSRFLSKALNGIETQR